jgi:hypothetical protein
MHEAPLQPQLDDLVPWVSDPAATADGSTSDTVAAHHAKGATRGADTIWRPNPREQGLLGLTDAIQWFGQRGWSISMPLIDSQPYDLVADDGERLYRVQVKTTTRRTRYGIFVVQLCTRGGNQSFHTSKTFDPLSCDLLFALTDDRDRYLVPASMITSRTTLSLGDRMAAYRLPEKAL